MRPELVYWLGCIPTRIIITLSVYKKLVDYRVFAVFASFISLGFLSIWMFGLRKAPMESNGINWWNFARPIHGILWGASAILVFSGNYEHAYIPILMDTILGIVMGLSKRVLVNSIEKNV